MKNKLDYLKQMEDTFNRIDLDKEFCDRNNL